MAQEVAWHVRLLSAIFLDSTMLQKKRAANAAREPKSDLSDFGQFKVPNSGKPEFGWGGGAQGKSSIVGLENLS